MNPIRRFLLKIANGVGKEEVIPMRMAEMLRVNAPVETIKIGRSIGPEEYRVVPIADIISHSKREMAREIGEKMQEMGMIRYHVQEPLKGPERLCHSDIFDETYKISAEVRAVKWE